MRYLKVPKDHPVCLCVCLCNMRCDQKDFCYWMHKPTFRNHMISILINIMEHFFIILTVFEHLVNFRDKIHKKNDWKQWFFHKSWVTDQTFKMIPKINAGLLFPIPFDLLIIQWTAWSMTYEDPKLVSICFTIKEIFFNLC